MTTETRRFLTGVLNGWHAVETRALDPETNTPGCAAHAWSVCDKLVRVAKDEYQPYDPAVVPGSYDPCQACLWTVAARTGTLDAALARLADPLAHDTAAAILNEFARLHADLDDAHLMDDPATLQLVVQVARHAPVLLVTEECAEGECDHLGAGGPPCADCPGSLACRACSLQEGSWAGEWEGMYRTECTIPAPCAVLLRIAEHFGVTQ
jgi:hypothetical protein